MMEVRKANFKVNEVHPWTKFTLDPLFLRLS
jgi:hypothetical protein